MRVSVRLNALILADISHSNKLCFVKQNCLPLQRLCVIILYGADICTSPIEVINIAINLDSWVTFSCFADFCVKFRGQKWGKAKMEIKKQRLTDTLTVLKPIPHFDKNSDIASKFSFFISVARSFYLRQELFPQRCGTSNSNSNSN